MFKKTQFMTLLVLSVAALGLGACETVEGAGQDIENAGEGIQDASNDVQHGNY
jgi:predicted small secreted protein